jgi:peptidoglycan/LPS O-acetylase OafA/YrhL
MLPSSAQQNSAKNVTPSGVINHLWRNDITGLRALAVIPVLLFHAFPDVLPGGFFGVDVFFIISGYLIAGIIFRGLKANNFSYFNFYAKRIRRIIPNLMLVLLFVVSAGALFMSAEEFSRLGKNIQASTFFYENFQLLSEANYFDISSKFKPLLHLWSLSIEEQFYIFFPAIAAGLWELTKKITSSAKIATIALGILVCLLTFRVCGKFCGRLLPV